MSGISAHHTVDVLRGLPEGSRLRPTLFGVFVADLVHELRAKFPHDTNRQTHTPFDQDLPDTSELEAYPMLMTQPSCQYVRANCNLCFMPTNIEVSEIVCKLIQKKQK